MARPHTYICIDLKSFYASVECAHRGLDAMTTRLVVADPTRSDKTICLAVSPALKAMGVKNRCRLFEIPKNIDYIIAPPRMQAYIECSADIYEIYMKYIAKEDIYVYSIDEAFMDVTEYLSLYQMTAKELGQTIMADIYNTLGIRATCGIGSNMYLAKIALDITAKHSPDFIGELTEESFIKTLWNHTPLTDFWRIGRGTADKLAQYGITTMEQIAKTDEDFLYKLFGKDAELLIDHSRGIEPVTMEDVKNYKPSSNSLSSGQVLMRDYKYDEGMLIVKEMMDLLCLDMVSQDLITNSITLHVGYSNSLNIAPAHGTTSLSYSTNSDIIWIPAIEKLYQEIINPMHPIRRINITCNSVTQEECHQYNFFVDAAELERNKKIQKAVIQIKDKFGKNAILKGMNLQESSTMQDRNNQIGGHRSGE
ncbi:MAG: DNA repair protein [Lachnospiraceae bacterium]|nr:DNA repair protein [Lachnospiraceae bacterium]